MSLTALYNEMLNPGNAKLNAEMQERIREHCTRKKDWSTVAKLAQYQHLHPDVDGRIRDSEDLTVLTAWASRPGRTSEELAERLLGDKRVSALAPLAGLQGLSEEIYTTIAKVKSIKLAEILAGNPSVPLSIRKAKLAEFVRRHPRGAYNNHAERIHELCKTSGPDAEKDIETLYDTVARNTVVVPYILACLQRPYGAKHADRWIKGLGDIEAAGDHAWRHRVGDLVTLLGRLPLSVEQRDLLKANAEAIIAGISSSWEGSGIRRAVESLGEVHQEFAQALAALENAKDPTAAETAYQEARSLCQLEDRPRLAAVVARQEHLAVHLVLEMINNMQDRVDVPLFIARLEREKDTETILAILERHRRDQGLPVALRYVQDKLSVMEAYLAKVDTEGNLLPDWVVETEFLADRPELAVTHLRWARLTRAVGRNPRITEKVEAAILAELGGGPEWEAFDTLSEGFEGSLADLLGAAKALSA